MGEDRVLSLLVKAKYVMMSLVMVYIVLFAAGYIAGKGHKVEATAVMNSSIMKLSRTLEYKVPGYGALLGKYKAYHDARRNALLFKKDWWGMGLLIFMNNFIITNVMTIIRALFVVPVFLNMCGAFFQGVVLAQAPAKGLMWLSVIMEFGGYLITVGAALSGLIWVLLKNRFGFSSRKDALYKGLSILAFMLAISGVMIMTGTISEILLLRNMLGTLMK
jgi:hypothetical protein